MSEKKTYDVIYTPDVVLDALAGKKGKRGARPILFDVRQFKLNVKDENGKFSSRLMTYLIFGGVPPKAIHKALSEVGFKVRRRPDSWHNKKTGEDVLVKGQDRECYVVYYLDSDTEFGEDQRDVIGRCFMYISQAVAKKDHSGLMTTWDQVDQQYGDEDEWLTICTVPRESAEQKKEAPPATVGDTTIDFDDVADTF